MWSHEISQMTGQYTQQALMQGAYANSIGMANPGFAANQMAGTAMSGMAGIGAPVATAGLSLLGADPMSMGLRAGMAALPTMGVGGAIGAGAAVAAPAAAVWYGASAVGDQMMQGAQQQQNLNMSMRQNFSQFQNGGRGFSNSQLSGLGQQIRGMTHEVGQGGEMASFRELSSLASNMGKMGFVQTTRDVQQFGQKFRQMVDTLKTVAKDLGTNLEAAQEMTAGMRGSGIFQSADQIRMAQMMRGNAVSGNISTQETGAMSSIGAQIARSVGGRGRQGAFAGAKTIGQIGSALESGTLSEEDIYNATGQTGAVGRQAMATSMMQRSGQFMRSNRGRVMLASIAGENGQLDEAAVEDLMSGNMGLGNTMGNAGRNLAKVGAANFMRNEGKLRSAALEKFGGNIQTMQLMQWMGSSGIDLDSMGDKEMILAKRMTGMSEGEMEVAIKMAKNLRRDAEGAGDRKRQDEYLQTLRQKRSGQGVQGIRNSFNQFREKIQGGLQQAGAELYNETSNWIEGQINEMTGMYADALTDDTRKTFREMLRMGDQTATGRAAFSRQFGKIGGDIAGLGKVGALSTGGGGWSLAPGPGSDRDMESRRFGKFAEQEGAMGFLRDAFGGRSAVEKAGWDSMTYESDVLGADNKNRRAHEEKFYNQRRADTLATIAGSSGTADKDIMRAAATMGKDSLLKLDIVEELGAAGGDAYTRAMEDVINKEGTDEVRGKLEDLNRTIAEEKSGPKRANALKRKAQLMEAVGVKGGLTGKALRSGSSKNVFEGMALGGTYTTEKDRNMAYGAAIFGGVGEENRAEDTSIWDKVGSGAMKGAIAGSVLPVIGNMIGGAVGAIGGLLDYAIETDDEIEQKKQRWLDPAQTQAGGAFLRSARGKDLTDMAFGGKGDTSRFEKAKKKLMGMASERKGMTDKNMIAEYEVMRGAVAARELREAPKGKEDAVRKEVATKYFGGDEEKMMKTIRGMASAEMRDRRDQNRELASERSSMAKSELKSLEKTGGMYGEGGLIAALRKEEMSGESLMQIPGGNMEMVIEGDERLDALSQKKYAGARKMIAAAGAKEKALKALAGATGGTLGEATEEYMAGMSSYSNQLSAMSSAELKQTELAAREGVGGMGVDQLRAARGEQSRRRSAAMSVGRKGANLAAAGFLGIEGMSKMDQHRLRTAKGPEGMIKELEAMGVDLADEDKKDITTLLEELKTGKSGRLEKGTSASAVRANAAERLKAIGQREGGIADKAAERRLEGDRRENPVQAKMLDALNKMSENLDLLARDKRDTKPGAVNIANASEVGEALAARVKNAGGGGRSDERLKTDVEVVDSALEDVDKMRGVRFTWKHNEESDVGVIAQEVEKVVPEAVHEGEDGYLFVEYYKLIPVLLEAVKELRSRNDKLESRIVELENA